MEATNCPHCGLSIDAEVDKAQDDLQASIEAKDRLMAKHLKDKMNKIERMEQLLGNLDEYLMEQSKTQAKIRKILHELFKINARE